jgi:hypothetical protein
LTNVASGAGGYQESRDEQEGGEVANDECGRQAIMSVFPQQNEPGYHWQMIV